MSDTTSIPSLFPIVGPGSQPSDADGAQFDFMEMPDGMGVYQTPMIPEPEEVDAALEPALDLLDEIRAALASHRLGEETRPFDLGRLDAANRAFIDQALGEGEVSAVGGAVYQVQETVLTGVWRVRRTDASGALIQDLIEVAGFPRPLIDLALEGAAAEGPDNLDPLPAGVANAPALLTEIADAVAARLRDAPGAPAHVINLSLLPLTEEDVVYLDERLGKGPTIILSRGYGNCRITSTGVRGVWWVQYFNSADAIILNTVEIVTTPAVACAAQEDIDDSAQRLGEIIGVYR